MIERDRPGREGADPAEREPAGRPGSAAGYGRFRDVGAMARATFFGRCPECGEGRMFRDAYALHETCPVCGVRFERDTGSWLGALVMTYGVAILVLVAVSIALISSYGLFRGFGLTLAGVAIATVLLVYRPAKGWWTWWMWAAGFVYRDDERPERRKG